ncbi:MAG: PilZ domain-containing protein [Deltaproteobacteria bacterium]|nr:PilZ domain-containing protein [Deltaproteobacteria bacterium]
MARPQDTVETAHAELPEALRYQQSEARMATTLPARLTTADGEIVPVLLADLSPTGVLLVTDRRFGEALPPAVGATAWLEFFLDEVEVAGAAIRVRACKLRGRFQLEIGCSFVDLSDGARTAIRSKVAAARIARRR